MISKFLKSTPAKAEQGELSTSFLFVSALYDIVSYSISAFTLQVLWGWFMTIGSNVSIFGFSPISFPVAFGLIVFIRYLIPVEPVPDKSFGTLFLEYSVSRPLAFLFLGYFAVLIGGI